MHWACAISSTARRNSVPHQPGIAGVLQGMSEDVSINRFFDDPMLLELVRLTVLFLIYALHCASQAFSSWLLCTVVCMVEGLQCQLKCDVMSQARQDADLQQIF